WARPFKSGRAQDFSKPKPAKTRPKPGLSRPDPTRPSLRLALEAFTNALLRSQLLSPPRRNSLDPSIFEDSATTSDAVESGTGSTRQSIFVTRKPQAH
ncbi:hypothetical protein DFH09DRAFT_999396, partial [Mycena vulgaris]